MTRTDVACQGRQIAVLLHVLCWACPSGRVQWADLCVPIPYCDGWRDRLREHCQPAKDRVKPPASLEAEGYFFHT